MRRAALLLAVATLAVACGESAPARTAAATASAATPKVVYVKGSEFAGSIYIAGVTGSKPKKLGRGAFPAIAPNGRWIAYLSTDLDELRLVPPTGGEFLQTTIDDTNLHDLRFSPNSKFVGVVSGSRLYVNTINTGETVKTPRATIQGWSFSPDSKRIVYAKAATGAEYGAPSDLYTFDLATHRSTRMTTDRAALNPLWTKLGIVYDQRTGDGAFPHFNLQRRNDAGGDVENVVDNGPTPDELTSGLVPVAASSNGKRILASFAGQSRNDPYAVESLTARALLSSGTVTPTDLSRDGSTVLGFTGVGDPSDGSDVVTIPWAGGTPKVLVRNAIWARWNR